MAFEESLLLTMDYISIVSLSVFSTVYATRIDVTPESLTTGIDPLFIEFLQASPSMALIDSVRLVLNETLGLQHDSSATDLSQQACPLQS